MQIVIMVAFVRSFLSSYQSLLFGHRNVSPLTAIVDRALPFSLTLYVSVRSPHQFDHLLSSGTQNHSAAIAAAATNSVDCKMFDHTYEDVVRFAAAAVVVTSDNVAVAAAAVAVEGNNKFVVVAADKLSL